MARQALILNKNDTKMPQMRTLTVALTLVLAAIATNCATTKQLQSLDVGKSAPGTYALFSFQVEGPLTPTPQCRLILNSKATQEVQIYAFPAGNWGLIPLPAGAYSYDNIDCGLGSRYLLTSPFGKKQNEFSVLPGKINYLGHTTLVFDSKKDLNLNYDQKDHLASIKDLFAKLPKDSWAAGNIVSAYTQRSIKADTVTFDLLRSYSINSRAPKEEQEKLKGLLAVVQAKIGKCADAEALTNPLKLGALQTVYSVKNGKLIEGQRRENHVYSKSFVGCVQAAMASIPYATSYPVSVVMAL